MGKIGKSMGTVNYKYIVSLEIADILGSGSSFEKVVETYNQKQAFDLLKDGRNRLERIGKVNGEIVNDLYIDNKWIKIYG